MANLTTTYFGSPRAITVGSKLLLRKTASSSFRKAVLRTINTNDVAGAISVTVNSVSELEGYYTVLTDAGLLSVSLVDSICFVR